ncbi:MAG: LytTR family DNA-binding domain-containing protein [Agarilytica sp.]
MKAIIVEDSRLAREGLKAQLAVFSDIDVVGEAENADEGESLILNVRPDVVFLDIDMPGRSGLEMLSDLACSPSIVFTTAYSEYAIRSFDFNTVDYLLKPVDPGRLGRAIQKVRRISQDSHDESAELNEKSRLFVRDKETSYLVELSRIRYFESCGNYTRLYFDDAAPFVYKSLSRVERRLPSDSFFRVSRQHIVNLVFVETMDESVSGGYTLTLKGGETVSVSRAHSSRLREIFSL